MVTKLLLFSVLLFPARAQFFGGRQARQTGYDKASWGLCVSGTCTTGTNVTVPYITVQATMYPSKCRMAAQTAPVGSSFRVDVQKNSSTSIFTTPFSLPSGSTSAVVTSFANGMSLSDGDLLTIDIVQVGSTTPGAGVSVVCEFTTAAVVGGTPADTGGTVTSVDGSAKQGLETIQGGIVAAITTAGTIRASSPVNSQNGTSYTVLSADRGGLVTFNNSSAVAVSLPAAGSNFPNGWLVDVENLGAGTVTITPVTSTIDGASSLTLPTGQGTRIFSNGTNYFTMRGMDAVTSVFGRTGAVTAQTGDYNSDKVTEGSTNLYFTNARVRGALSAAAGISFNSSTGQFSLSTIADQRMMGNVSGVTAVPIAITAAQVRTFLGLAAVATSGAYADLSGAPWQDSSGVISPVTLTDRIAIGSHALEGATDLLIRSASATSAVGGDPVNFPSVLNTIDDCDGPNGNFSFASLATTFSTDVENAAGFGQCFDGSLQIATALGAGGNGGMLLSMNPTGADKSMIFRFGKYPDYPRIEYKGTIDSTSDGAAGSTSYNHADMTIYGRADPTSHYFNSAVALAAVTADSNHYENGYTLLNEGTMLDDGTVTLQRVALYDHSTSSTLWYHDSLNPDLFVFGTARVLAPAVVGGTEVGSSLSLRSTAAVGTTDAIVFQVGNNGATEGGRFNHDGSFSANVSISTPTVQFSSHAEPTCDSAHRGMLDFVQGGSGVADTFRVCAKDASNNYGWQSLL